MGVGGGGRRRGHHRAGRGGDGPRAHRRDRGRHVQPQVVERARRRRRVRAVRGHEITRLVDDTPLIALSAGSQTGDQLLDSLVVGPEGVLQQHRPLGLVVELEMDPVDGEVPAALLGPPDELAPQAGPGRLRAAGSWPR